MTSTSATGATFEVRAPQFVVDVTAVGDASWVQATQAGGTNPTFSGILEGGQSKTFTVRRALRWRSGRRPPTSTSQWAASRSASDFPTAAPFDMTFKAVS